MKTKLKMKTKSQTKRKKRQNEETQIRNTKKHHQKKNNTTTTSTTATTTTRSPIGAARGPGPGALRFHFSWPLRRTGARYNVGWRGGNPWPAPSPF